MISSKSVISFRLSHATIAMQLPSLRGRVFNDLRPLIIGETLGLIGWALILIAHENQRPRPEGTAPVRRGRWHSPIRKRTRLVTRCSGTGHTEARVDRIAGPRGGTCGTDSFRLRARLAHRRESSNGLSVGQRGGMEAGRRPPPHLARTCSGGVS